MTAPQAQEPPSAPLNRYRGRPRRMCAQEESLRGHARLREPGRRWIERRPPPPHVRQLWIVSRLGSP